MARSLNCGSNVKRSDTFFVDPREITVDWSLNGRTDTFTPEAIARLAKDIEENGQLQPVACRSLPEKRVGLIYGYNRLRAALAICEHNPDFRLEIKVYDGLNDRDAFLMNLRENMIRSEVSPIDNAVNIRKLLNNYGFTNGEVADLYKRSPTWVTQTLKLLTLPEPVKEAVAEGVISQETGTLLAGLSGAEATEALQAGVAAVEAEEAAEIRVEETTPEPDTVTTSEPDITDPVPSLTVDDAALADAIGSLPPRPKTALNPKPPKATKKKTAKDLTPAEVQSRKTARQAKISAEVKKQAQAKGVKVLKTAADLKKLIGKRQDDVSRKLVGYLAGEVSDDDLILSLDMCESPIVATPTRKATNGPVTSLA